MNSFSNMEINDLLDNRFRLDDKHTLSYLAECFQRLFPTLGRMGLSTVIDEMARANSRCFGATDGDMPSGAGMRHCEANSSRLPVRGETLNLNFFFELWKRNFRFESGIYDKFVFSDELKLAFKINSREFWEVLIRADRDLGNYLKDSIELLNRPASAIHGSAGTSASMPRDLPQAISLNLRLNGSSPDDKTVRLLREKLPYSKDNVTTHDIAKVCLQLFEVAHPADYDIRRLAEDLERENSIHRLNGEFTAIIPKKALDRFSTKSVLEFFKNKPLTSSEASAMERGVYTVTEVDILLASQQGSDAFWQSIIPDKTIRERTLNMWKLAGMDSDARKFTKGKQILIATERALSDALHKHSAEMRDVYPLCRQAGVSTQDADKFMAMLYLCHDFYKGLANVYINTAMLAHFGAPAARRLWDTIKTEGLKKDGIGKIKSSVETETEKLNREVKEAIANGTAKIKKIDLKLLDEQGTEAKFDWGKKRLFGIAALMRGDSAGKPEIPALVQQELLLRSDYRGHGDPVEPAPAYPAIGAKYGNLFNISQSGSDFIKKHENLVLYVYGDKDNSWPRKRITIDNYSSIKGYPTIGYGYKIINKVELESYLKNGITEAQAIELFEKTLPAYVDDVKRNTKNFILTQHQFDALVSFVYNAGLPAVMRSEVYKGLLEGDIKKAAEGFLLEIPKYDGSVNKGLAERRRAESEMFLQH